MKGGLVSTEPGSEPEASAGMLCGMLAANCGMVGRLGAEGVRPGSCGKGRDPEDISGSEGADCKPEREWCDSCGC